MIMTIYQTFLMNQILMKMIIIVFGLKNLLMKELKSEKKKKEI